MITLFENVIKIVLLITSTICKWHKPFMRTGSVFTDEQQRENDSWTSENDARVEAQLTTILSRNIFRKLVPICHQCFTSVRNSANWRWIFPNNVMDFIFTLVPIFVPWLFWSDCFCSSKIPLNVCTIWIFVNYAYHKKIPSKFRSSTEIEWNENYNIFMVNYLNSNFVCDIIMKKNTYTIISI